MRKSILLEKGKKKNVARLHVVGKNLAFSILCLSWFETKLLVLMKPEIDESAIAKRAALQGSEQLVEPALFLLHLINLVSTKFERYRCLRTMEKAFSA